MLQNALLVCTKHQRCHNSYAMQLDLDHKTYRAVACDVTSAALNQMCGKNV